MTSTNDDIGLGEAPDAAVNEPSLAEPGDDTRNAEDFDLDDWLGGVRPTQRAVRLYAKSDLIARMDQLAEQIDDLPDDADADDLIDELEDLRAQFQASGAWFIVQKRSKEWQDDFRRDTGKRLGVKNSDKPMDRWPEDQQLKVLMHQVAEQTVSPQITAAQLWKLRDANELELNKLLYTVAQVNTVLAESAPALSSDFSERRSGHTPTS